MVRKVIALSLMCVMLITATCGAAYAQEPYDGNMSSTYVTYFKDIVAGIGFKDNYVAFRSGQNEYTMLVGELYYDGETISLVGMGTKYTIYNDNSYNGLYTYDVSSVETGSVTPRNKIVYSDLGNYPQLIDRGAKYETLTSFLLVVALLCVVVGRFFGRR